MKKIKIYTVNADGIDSEYFAKYCLVRTFGGKADDYSIYRTKYGKPYLKNCKDKFFSISHTKGLTVCAVSEFEIGVDAEYKRNIGEEKLSRMCSPKEIEYIKNASSISDGFTEIWTKKEAYLKALGTGIRNVRLRDVKTDNAISLKFNNYYISICFA